jgi:hypothetical protein
MNRTITRKIKQEVRRVARRDYIDFQKEMALLPFRDRWYVGTGIIFAIGQNMVRLRSHLRKLPFFSGHAD